MLNLLQIKVTTKSACIYKVKCIDEFINSVFNFLLIASSCVDVNGMNLKMQLHDANCMVAYLVAGSTFDSCTIYACC